jgi:hypothetical protein
MSLPDFTRLETAVAAAAADGVAAAAETFAQRLNAMGETTAVSRAPDGVMEVLLEGAGLTAREFGTRGSPARPALGPALQASRADISAIIAQKIGNALRGGR